MPTNEFVQRGDTIDYVAPADITAPTMAVAGNLIGFVGRTAASGETVGLAVEGVVEYTKKTTDVIAVGAVVYWDATEDEITTTAGSNKIAGHAVAAAGNGDTLVQFKLAQVNTS